MSRPEKLQDNDRLDQAMSKRSNRSSVRTLENSDLVDVSRSSVPTRSVPTHVPHNISNNDYIENLLDHPTSPTIRANMVLAFQNLDVNHRTVLGGRSYDSVSDEELRTRAAPSSDFQSFLETSAAVQARQFFPPYDISATTDLSSRLPAPNPAAVGPTASTRSQRDRGQSSQPEETSWEEPPLSATEQAKRKRNTAASARFREKKRQREQEVEQSLRDSRTKHAELSDRVGQLESENRNLRNVLHGTNTARSEEDVGSEDDTGT